MSTVSPGCTRTGKISAGKTLTVFASTPSSVAGVAFVILTRSGNVLSQNTLTATQSVTVGPFNYDVNFYVDANLFTLTLTEAEPVTAVASSGGGSASAGYPSPISATLASSVDDFTSGGYVGGTTSRLILMPASGGSTLNGIGAGTDGWPLIIKNAGASDLILLSHLAGTSQSANRFSCPGAAPQALLPGASCLLVYDTSINKWTFAS